MPSCKVMQSSHTILLSRQQEPREDCMIGGIYSEEDCPLCGQRMKDNGKTAVCCPVHKQQRANRLRVVIKKDGKWVKKRFSAYDKAYRFLTGLRFKIDEGSFDHRDYQRENPLGFANLAEKWLKIKQGQVKRHSWDNLNNAMRKAAGVWGNRNIKEIGTGEVEDFIALHLRGLSSKSLYNTRSVLNSFWAWLVRRDIVSLGQVPKMPQLSVELEFRATISKAEQAAILDEIERISRDVNPRVWLAVKWLATYISIRPWELVCLKEGDINRDQGLIIIPHPKEKTPKVVPLTEEDADLVRVLPRAFPELFFFRHFKGHGGATPGQRFGPRYLYRWWKRACTNLGIDGIDLYGGTRHSTAIYLGQYFSPEEIKQATMHTTNKAFERYFRVPMATVRNVYEVAMGVGNKRETKITPLRKISD